MLHHSVSESVVCIPKLFLIYESAASCYNDSTVHMKSIVSVVVLPMGHFATAEPN